MKTYEETMNVVETIDQLNNKKDYYINVWANNPNYQIEGQAYAWRRAYRLTNDIKVLEKEVKNTVRALLKERGWQGDTINLLFEQNTIHGIMKNWEKFWRC